LFLPSESLPALRLNQIADPKELSGERRMKTWPFHSTAVGPLPSLLRTVAPIEDQSQRGIFAQRPLVIGSRV
jgi:hypothetical protein